MKDYYSDYGHNFVKIFKNSELPEFVKNAETISEERLAAMPDEAFANKVARKLPISSAADTYISTAYYITCNNKDENVNNSLSKAAKFWGITKQVEELSAELTKSLSKTASDTEAEGWSFSHKTATNNAVEIAASGTTNEELSQASEKFLDKAAFFPFSDRVVVAKQIAELFEKRGLDIPFELGAMSERNFPNPEVVAQEIKSRAIRLEDTSKRAGLIKIADALLESKDRDIEGYSKLAEMIDQVDAENFLGRFYGKSLKNAHEAVFNTSKQDAINAIQTIKLGSGEYSLIDLNEIHDDILKLALTDEDYKMISEDRTKTASISEASKKALAEYI